MKRSAIAVLVAVVAAAAFTGSTWTQGKTDAALDRLAKEFSAAFTAKDAAKLASFYTDDAVVMPPNQPMVKGRAAIQAHFTRDFEAGVTNLQLKPMESAIAGSQAFEAGTATVTLPGGQTIASKYLVVYKRVGADWKLAYDIYNSDQPLPPMQK